MPKYALDRCATLTADNAVKPIYNIFIFLCKINRNCFAFWNNNTLTLLNYD